jgi:hypothetical protein
MVPVPNVVISATPSAVTVREKPGIALLAAGSRRRRAVAWG